MRIKVQSSWFYSIKNWNLWKNIVKIERKDKVNATLEFILLIVNHAGASDHFLNWSAKASPQIAPEKDFVLRLKVDALYARTSCRLYYQIHQIDEDFGKLLKTFKGFEIQNYVDLKILIYRSNYDRKQNWRFGWFEQNHN